MLTNRRIEIKILDKKTDNEIQLIIEFSSFYGDTIVYKEESNTGVKIKSSIDNLIFETKLKLERFLNNPFEREILDLHDYTLLFSREINKYYCKLHKETEEIYGPVTIEEVVTHTNRIF